MKAHTRSTRERSGDAAIQGSISFPSSVESSLRNVWPSTVSLEQLAMEDLQNNLAEVPLRCQTIDNGLKNSMRCPKMMLSQAIIPSMTLADMGKQMELPWKLPHSSLTVMTP